MGFSRDESPVVLFILYVLTQLHMQQVPRSWIPTNLRKRMMYSLRIFLALATYFSILLSVSSLLVRTKNGMAYLFLYHVQFRSSCARTWRVRKTLWCCNGRLSLDLHLPTTSDPSLSSFFYYFFLICAAPQLRTLLVADHLE